MQNQFYQRFNQGHGSFDNSEGTWQMPQQQQQLGQEDTYFTGNSTNYYTNQQSTGGGGSALGPGGHVVGGGSEGKSPVFSTGITGYSKNNVGSNHLNYKGLGSQSQYTSDSGNNSQFMSNKGSNQDRFVGKMTHSSQDDGDNCYYGFPNESYLTNSGGNMAGPNSGNVGVGGNSINMGNFGGNSVNMGSNSMNMGSNSVNMGNNSMNFGNNGNSLRIRNNSSPMGSGLSVENSGNFATNVMGNYGSENMMGMSNGGNNMGSDNSGNFGNVQLQNQLMAAAVGVGALASLSENYGNSSRFNNPMSFGNTRRGKRGQGLGSNQYKSPHMFSNDETAMMGGQRNHQTGGNNLSINLNATNHNQWCFLRKKFNKRDNDFVEHLFDIHEKFCHQCRERIEEKKYGKKKKYSDELRETEEPPVEEEIPDEELTHDELEMKKLMGFAGFKTTKGFRVKDNNYSTVSSLNALGSSNAVDETTTLTESEKRMIALSGGFSVFTKPVNLGPSGPGFGAPAVTFDPIDSNRPGSQYNSQYNNKN